MPYQSPYIEDDKLIKSGNHPDSNGYAEDHLHIRDFLANHEAPEFMIADEDTRLKMALPYLTGETKTKVEEILASRYYLVTYSRKLANGSRSTYSEVRISEKSLKDILCDSNSRFEYIVLEAKLDTGEEP